MKKIIMMCAVMLLPFGCGGNSSAMVPLDQGTHTACSLPGDCSGDEVCCLGNSSTGWCTTSAACTGGENNIQLCSPDAGTSSCPNDTTC